MSLLSHSIGDNRHGMGQADDFIGSHMPLDTESHWKWNNPVNLLPALVLLLILLVGIML